MTYYIANANNDFPAYKIDSPFCRILPSPTGGKGYYANVVAAPNYPINLRSISAIEMNSPTFIVSGHPEIGAGAYYCNEALTFVLVLTEEFVAGKMTNLFSLDSSTLPTKSYARTLQSERAKRIVDLTAKISSISDIISSGDFTGAAAVTLKIANVTDAAILRDKYTLMLRAVMRLSDQLELATNLEKTLRIPYAPLATSLIREIADDKVYMGVIWYPGSPPWMRSIDIVAAALNSGTAVDLTNCWKLLPFSKISTSLTSATLNKLFSKLSGTDIYLFIVIYFNVLTTDFSQWNVKKCTTQFSYMSTMYSKLITYDPNYLYRLIDQLFGTQTFIAYNNVPFVLSLKNLDPNSFGDDSYVQANVFRTISSYPNPTLRDVIVRKFQYAPNYSKDELEFIGENIFQLPDENTLLKLPSGQQTLEYLFTHLKFRWITNVAMRYPTMTISMISKNHKNENSNSGVPLDFFGGAIGRATIYDPLNLLGSVIDPLVSPYSQAIHDASFRTLYRALFASLSLESPPVLIFLSQFKTITFSPASTTYATIANLIESDATILAEFRKFGENTYYVTNNENIKNLGTYFNENVFTYMSSYADLVSAIVTSATNMSAKRGIDIDIVVPQYPNTVVLLAYFVIVATRRLSVDSRDDALYAASWILSLYNSELSTEITTILRNNDQWKILSGAYENNFKLALETLPSADLCKSYLLSKKNLFSINSVPYDAGLVPKSVRTYGTNFLENFGYVLETGTSLEISYYEAPMPWNAFEWSSLQTSTITVVTGGDSLRNLLPNVSGQIISSNSDVFPRRFETLGTLWYVPISYDIVPTSTYLIDGNYLTWFVGYVVGSDSVLRFSHYSNGIGIGTGTRCLIPANIIETQWVKIFLNTTLVQQGYLSNYVPDSDGIVSISIYESEYGNLLDTSDVLWINGNVVPYTAETIISPPQNLTCPISSVQFEQTIVPDPEAKIGHLITVSNGNATNMQGNVAYLEYQFSTGSVYQRVANYVADAPLTFVVENGVLSVTAPNPYSSEIPLVFYRNNRVLNINTNLSARTITISTYCVGDVFVAKNDVEKYDGIYFNNMGITATANGKSALNGLFPEIIVPKRRALIPIETEISFASGTSVAAMWRNKGYYDGDETWSIVRGYYANNEIISMDGTMTLSIVKNAAYCGKSEVYLGAISIVDGAENIYASGYENPIVFNGSFTVPPVTQNLPFPSQLFEYISVPGMSEQQKKFTVLAAPIDVGAAHVKMVPRKCPIYFVLSLNNSLVAAYVASLFGATVAKIGSNVFSSSPATDAKILRKQLLCDGYYNSWVPFALKYGVSNEELEQLFAFDLSAPMQQLLEAGYSGTNPETLLISAIQWKATLLVDVILPYTNVTDLKSFISEAAFGMIMNTGIDAKTTAYAYDPNLVDYCTRTANGVCSVEIAGVRSMTSLNSQHIISPASASASTGTAMPLYVAPRYCGTYSYGISSFFASQPIVLKHSVRLVFTVNDAAIDTGTTDTGYPSWCATHEEFYSTWNGDISKIQSELLESSFSMRDVPFPKKIYLHDNKNNIAYPYRKMMGITGSWRSGNVLAPLQNSAINGVLVPYAARSLDLLLFPDTTLTSSLDAIAAPCVAISKGIVKESAFDLSYGNVWEFRYGSRKRNAYAYPQLLSQIVGNDSTLELETTALRTSLSPETYSAVLATDTAPVSGAPTMPVYNGSELWSGKLPGTISGISMFQIYDAPGIHVYTIGAAVDQMMFPSENVLTTLAPYGCPGLYENTSGTTKLPILLECGGAPIISNSAKDYWSDELSVVKIYYEIDMGIFTAANTNFNVLSRSGTINTAPSAVFGVIGLNPFILSFVRNAAPSAIIAWPVSSAPYSTFIGYVDYLGNGTQNFEIDFASMTDQENRLTGAPLDVDAIHIGGTYILPTPNPTNCAPYQTPDGSQNCQLVRYRNSSDITVIASNSGICSFSGNTQLTGNYSSFTNISYPIVLSRSGLSTGDISSYTIPEQRNSAYSRSYVADKQSCGMPFFRETFHGDFLEDNVSLDAAHQFNMKFSGNYGIYMQNYPIGRWIVLEYDYYGVPDEDFAFRYPLAQADLGLLGNCVIGTIGETETTIQIGSVETTGLLAPVSVVSYDDPTPHLDAISYPPYALLDGVDALPYISFNTRLFDIDDQYIRRTRPDTATLYSRTIALPASIEGTGKFVKSVNVSNASELSGKTTLKVCVMNRIVKVAESAIEFEFPIPCAYNAISTAPGTYTVYELERYVNTVFISKAKIMNPATRFYCDGIRETTMPKPVSVTYIPAQQYARDLPTIDVRPGYGSVAKFTVNSIVYGTNSAGLVTNTPEGIFTDVVLESGPTYVSTTHTALLPYGTCFTYDNTISRINPIDAWKTMHNFAPDSDVSEWSPEPQLDMTNFTVQLVPGISTKIPDMCMSVPPAGELQTFVTYISGNSQQIVMSRRAINVCPFMYNTVTNTLLINGVEIPVLRSGGSDGSGTNFLSDITYLEMGSGTLTPGIYMDAVGDIYAISTEFTLNITPDLPLWNPSTTSTEFLSSGKLYRATCNYGKFKQFYTYTVVPNILEGSPLKPFNLGGLNSSSPSPSPPSSPSLLRPRNIFRDPVVAMTCSRVTKYDILTTESLGQAHLHWTSKSPYYEFGTFRYMSPDISAVTVSKSLLGHSATLSVPWDTQIMNAVIACDLVSFKSLLSTSAEIDLFVSRFVIIGAPGLHPTANEVPEISAVLAVKQLDWVKTVIAALKTISATANSDPLAIQFLQIFHEYCVLTKCPPAEIAILLAVCGNLFPKLMAPIGYRISDADDMSKSIVSTMERIAFSVAVDFYDDWDTNDGFSYVISECSNCFAGTFGYDHNLISSQQEESVATKLELVIGSNVSVRIVELPNTFIPTAALIEINNNVQNLLKMSEWYMKFLTRVGFLFSSFNPRSGAPWDFVFNNGVAAYIGANSCGFVNPTDWPISIDLSNTAATTISSSNLVYNPNGNCLYLNSSADSAGNVTVLSTAQFPSPFLKFVTVNSQGSGAILLTTDAILVNGRHLNLLSIVPPEHLTIFDSSAIATNAPLWMYTVENAIYFCNNNGTNLCAVWSPYCMSPYAPILPCLGNIRCGIVSNADLQLALSIVNSA